MTRYAQVIHIRPERLEVYKQLHMAVWPAVLAKISECNMRNYSIFLHEDHTLYAYFEYVGDDFAGGHGEDGRRPDDAGMVGDLLTDAAAGVAGGAGRALAQHRGSVPPGLTADDRRLIAVGRRWVRQNSASSSTVMLSMMFLSASLFPSHELAGMTMRR